jgi:hypothetical protein
LSVGDPGSDRSATEPGASSSGTPTPFRTIFAFAVLTLFVATVLAVTAAYVARWSGGSPKVQRIAAYGGIAVAMFGLLAIPNLRTSDPPALVATLIALSTVIVGALTYVGPIEKTPPLGCINSHGPYSAAAAAQPTIVWSQTSAASDGKTLLNQGCVFHFSHYCVGHVHKEILEDHFIPEARWIVLPDDQGFVPFGYAIGQLPSPKEDPDAKRTDCPGHIAEPDKLLFARAVLLHTPKKPLLILSATSPRAAMVGFALQLTRGKEPTYMRIGWDRSPEDDLSVAFAATPQMKKGGKIVAVSCIGFRAPAASAPQATRTIAVTHAARKIKPSTRPSSQSRARALRPLHATQVKRRRRSRSPTSLRKRTVRLLSERERPYQDYSERELRDAKREVDREHKSASQQMDRLFSRGGLSQQAQDDLGGRAQRAAHISLDIEAEFAARRNERAERRQAAERRQTEGSSRGKSGGGRGANLVPLHCECQRPRRIKVLTHVFQEGPIVCGVCQQQFKR